MKKLLIVMFTLFSTIGFISCGGSKENVNEETVVEDTLDVTTDSIIPDTSFVD